MKDLLLALESPEETATLVALLEGAGYGVRCAATSDEARAALAARVPDLLLASDQLDDGLDLVRALKREPATRAVPVIALTPGPFESQLLRAFEAGCEDCDLLPPLPERFLIKVRALIGAGEVRAGAPADPETSITAGGGSLRGLLHQVLGYAHLLHDGAADLDPERQRRGLALILDAGQRALAALPADRTAPPRPAPPAPEERTEEPALPRASAGHYLVVEPNPAMSDLLGAILELDGHFTQRVASAAEALERLASARFDGLIVDTQLAGTTGVELLSALKADPRMRHTPVVVISASDDPALVARCIELGAEDFLTKPFDPALLRARISANLEYSRLRDLEREHLRTIRETQSRLMEELNEAARYVQSILPAPLHGAVAAEGRVVPSTEMGGDCYGHHWLDETRLAIFVLDVCGHGVGAALLSVSAAQTIRRALSADADPLRPGAYLTELNEHFLMQRNGGMFLTVWYGVLDTAARTLTYASAGHPPALAIGPDGTSTTLQRGGLVLGGRPGTVYREHVVPFEPGSKLFAYSDGAYELRDAGGVMQALPDFLEFLAAEGRAGDGEIARVIDRAERMHGDGPVADDLTIVKVHWWTPAPAAFRRTLPSHMDSLAIVLDHARDCLGAVLPPDRNALMVAIEEMVKNSIEHGRPTADDPHFDVSLSVDSTTARVTLSDVGQPFDPTAAPAPAPHAPGTARVSGGLGIHLTRNLMSSMRYRRVGDRNMLELERRLADR